MRCHIRGVGLCGPGLAGWGASRAVLAGAQPYMPAPTGVPPSTLLPANERRRAVPTVKLALAVGAEAFAGSGLDPAETASVFASSGGDGDTIHEIMNTLASPERALSPTRFHNSVHNAAAGYWSIAAQSRAASTSLCCHDDSFAAGLLEAMAQVAVEQRDTVLMAYDMNYPFPLSELRPVIAPFAVALVLSASPGGLGGIELNLAPGASAPSPAPPALEALRQGAPAARALPLLCALARGLPASINLAYLDTMTLALRFSPSGPL